jgi:hypothetical protein
VFFCLILPLNCYRAEGQNWAKKIQLRVQIRKVEKLTLPKTVTFAECLKHSTKSGKHLTKALPSVTLGTRQRKVTVTAPGDGKQSSTNCTSATASLSSTTLQSVTRYSAKKSYRHGARWRRRSRCRVPQNDTWQKAHSLPSVHWVAHSTKKHPVGPFARSVVESIRWHSTKAPSLPSARRISTRQRNHQRAPLSVPLPSALDDTRQGSNLCRVSRPHHSAKWLYRCPGVPSLSSVVTMTLSKVPLCRVLHSAKWPEYPFFICFCYSI